MAQFPGDSSYHRLHLCEDGTGTDNYHSTVEDAIHQTAFEFDVTADE